MNSHIKDISFKVLTGLFAIVLAFLLLLSLNLFSTSLAPKPPETIMVVQLLNLPQPVAPQPKKPVTPAAQPLVKPKEVIKPKKVKPKKPKKIKPKKIKPKKKQPKKKLIKKPKPELKPEPKVEPKVAAQPKPKVEPEPKVETKPLNQPPKIKVRVSALPTPVPVFKLTSSPQFLNKITPVYPEQLRHLGQSGTVTLSVLIDAEGKVRKIDVLKSAGALFDQAAIDAITDSTFLPAKVGSKSVAVKLKLPIKFSLQ